MTYTALIVATALASGAWPLTTTPLRDARLSTSGSSVTVVLKERFPQEHIAALVRRTPGSNGQDIIAIRRSAASPELLGAALLAVAKVRQRQGAVPTKTTLIIPLGIKLPPMAAAEKARLGDAINRLLAAAPRPVPAVGYVPAISLDLP